MTSTTEVTREYVQDHDPPKRGEGYSVKLSGNSQTKEDIAQQLLSLSLSSPNINSYTFNINQPQGEAVIRHNRSSHDRLVVLHFLSVSLSWFRIPVKLFSNSSKNRFFSLRRRTRRGIFTLKKWKRSMLRRREKKLEWEVFSRIAQGMWVLSEIIIVKRNSPTGGQA